MRHTRLVLLAILLSPSLADAEKALTFTAQDELPAAATGIKLLRDVMRDPDSLVIERVYALTNHKLGHPDFCIRFRAKNAYGGYSRQMAEYKGTVDLSVDEGKCNTIELNWDRAEKKGWVDLTEVYFKRQATPDTSGASAPSSSDQDKTGASK